MVRRLAVTLLEQAEFEVFSAAGGAEAIELLRANSALFDCAIIDLTMPGMDGLEVADAVRGLRPSLPIILMSGYAPAIGDSGGMYCQATAFLQKPFTADALVDSVRAVLDNQGG